MSLEWKSVPLGSCCNFQEGYVNPSQKNPKYFDGDIKWIRAVDLNDGYVYETSRTLTAEGFNSAGKSALLFKPNTIVISKSGTVGRLGIIKDYMCGNRATINIIPYDNVSMKFIFYVLKYHQRHFSDMAVGSVQKNLYVSILENLEIPLPSIDIQNKIAYILSNIDDKIDCIYKINKNLEQYLFYLFNEYFMEFDFNEFSNSNKTIPSSWKLGCFNDIIDSLGSGDWGKEKQTGNYIREVYCIRGADIPDVKQGNKGKMPIRFILPKNFEKRKLGENSIVIEISGGSPTQSTGRTVFITDNFLNRFDKDIICTNFCKVINPKNEYAIFLYLYLNYLYDKDVMFAYENGTTGIKNFDIKSFISNFKIVIPSIEDIIKFNNLVQNVFDVIMHNGLEIEQLQKLRDTLLPKLMSGEIDVSQINFDMQQISTNNWDNKFTVPLQNNLITVIS